MTATESPAAIPVLLLHNLDASWPSEDRRSALEDVGRLRDGLEGLGHPVVPLPVTGPALPLSTAAYPPERYIVLNWCEELPGIPRSDARAASLLESMGYVFTGSDSGTLALSWDKPRVKRLLADEKIPTPRWRIYEDGVFEDWGRFPAIVKPAREHCSIGVTADAVVLNSEELNRRVTYVHRELRQPALVEDFIDGREFHVTVWGNGAATLLPPAEMDFSAFKSVRERLCTFDSKFLPGSRHYEEIRLRLPAPLSPGEYASLQSTVLDAYRLMRCRDYARIDLRLRDGVFYVLDINPNADISPDTSMAYAARTAGYTYGAMGSRLVGFAAQRHPVFGATPR